MANRRQSSTSLQYTFNRENGETFGKPGRSMSITSTDSNDSTRARRVSLINQRPVRKEPRIGPLSIPTLHAVKDNDVIFDLPTIGTKAASPRPLENRKWKSEINLVSSANTGPYKGSKRTTDRTIDYSAPSSNSQCAQPNVVKKRNELYGRNYHTIDRLTANQPESESCSSNVTNGSYDYRKTKNNRVPERFHSDCDNRLGNDSQGNRLSFDFSGYGTTQSPSITTDNNPHIREDVGNCMSYESSDKSNESDASDSEVFISDHTPVSPGPVDVRVKSSSSSEPSNPTINSSSPTPPVSPKKIVSDPPATRASHDSNGYTGFIPEPINTVSDSFELLVFENDKNTESNGTVSNDQVNNSECSFLLDLDIPQYDTPVESQSKQPEATLPKESSLIDFDDHNDILDGPLMPTSAPPAVSAALVNDIFMESTFDETDQVPVTGQILGKDACVKLDEERVLVEADTQDMYNHLDSSEELDNALSGSRDSTPRHQGAQVFHRIRTGSREDLSEGRGSLFSSPDATVPMSPTPSDADSGIDSTKADHQRTDSDSASRDSEKTTGSHSSRPDGSIDEDITITERLDVSPVSKTVTMSSSASSSKSSTTSSTKTLVATPDNTKEKTKVTKVASPEPDPPEPDPPACPLPRLNYDKDTGFTEVEMQKGGFGLGFCITGGRGSPLGHKPIAVKRLFKGKGYTLGGGAAGHGVLCPGDEIISANGKDFTLLSHYEAWNYLKKLPDGVVKLVIRRK